MQTGGREDRKICDVILDHMKKHLGLHATVFVVYTDPKDSIKISECVFWLYTYANSNMVFRFKSEGFKETH